MEVKLIQVVTGAGSQDGQAVYLNGLRQLYCDVGRYQVSHITEIVGEHPVKIQLHFAERRGKWPPHIGTLGIECEIPQPIGTAETKGLLDRIKSLEAELEATQVQLQVDTDMFRGDLNGFALALSKAKKATEEATLAADFTCGERDERMERIDAAAEEIVRMLYIHFGAKIGVNATGVCRESYAIIRHLNQLRNQLLA